MLSIVLLALPIIIIDAVAEDNNSDLLRDHVVDLRAIQDCMTALTADVSGLRGKLEIAYPEICFAVHDLAAERSQNYEMRAKQLADEIRRFLDG